MPSNDYSLIVILVVFVAFLFFSSRRRKAQASQLTNSVKVGANVVMLGGITGKIVSISDSTVVVETTPGTKIEFVKAAVRSVTAPSLDKAPVVKKAPVATKAAPAKAVKSSTTATKKTAK